MSQEGTKKCPKCHEEIQKQATTCKHCGADLRNWIIRHPIWSTVIGLLLISICLAAAKDTEKVTPPSASSPTSTADAQEAVPITKEWKQVFNLKGKGNQDTDSFTTTGGRIKLVAKTSGSRLGSFSSISLESDGGGYFSGNHLNISTDGSEDGTGETIVRDVKAGTYYVSVISGINWEVTVYEER